MKLPTHDEAEAAIDKNKADDLDWLIYNNEPADKDDALLFRDQVAAALNMAIELSRMDSQLKFESNNED